MMRMMMRMMLMMMMMRMMVMMMMMRMTVMMMMIGSDRSYTTCQRLCLSVLNTP